MRPSSLSAVVTSVAFAGLLSGAASVVAPSAARADGWLEPTSSSAVGTFGTIAYRQYRGFFVGTTSTGPYRVPYTLFAPANRSLSNRVVVVEPPHFAVGTGSLDVSLGRKFLFSRGFAHAAVGYSAVKWEDGTYTMRMLDPSAAGVYIEGGFEDWGGPGRTDDEIVIDCARALRSDAKARAALGTIDRRYAIGFSDSASTVQRIIGSGDANGVIDLALPFTADDDRSVTPEPEDAIVSGLFRGKVLIVDSEGGEWFEGLVDSGRAPNQYRFYQVAGTAHVSDPLVPFFANGSSPAGHQFDLRAHFLQADRWVRQGTAPPASTRLKTSDTDPSDGTTFDVDANGNTIAVNMRGVAVPRLPFVELGEARYLGQYMPPDYECCGFVGSYDTVKFYWQLGFASYGAYVSAFDRKVSAAIASGSLTSEDASDMMKRVRLCPPLTYTQFYQNAYDDFVAIRSCF